MRHGWARTLQVLVLGLAWATPAAGLQESRETLPGNPDVRLSEAVQESLRRHDAAQGGWPTEVLQSAAGAALKLIGRELFTPAGEDALFAVVSETVSAEPLVPKRRSQVFRDPLYVVERLNTRSQAKDASEGRAGLLQGLGILRAVFNGCTETHAHFKITGVEHDPEGNTVQTAVHVEFDGRGPAGAVQVTSEWRCEWSVVAKGELLLQAIEVLDYEQVRGPRQAEPQFRDVSASVLGSGVLAAQMAPGLTYWQGHMDSSLEVGTLGHHGLAVGDVNGDGLEDVYLCQPGGLPNRLLIHRSDGTVLDIAAASGVDILDHCSSALLLDLDNDLDLDLVVASATALVFFSNDGSGKFAGRLSIEARGSTMLSAVDVDGNGFLDIYVCGYLSPYDLIATPLPYYDANNGLANRMLVNDGKFGFRDRAEDLGLDVNNRRFSFAAAWEDYDRDGDQDLYVANDFGRNNLYRNDAGRFVDVAAQLGVEDLSAGMAVSWADVDGDGWMDLHVANMFSSAGNRVAYQRQFLAGAGSDTEVAGYRRHARGNSLFMNRAGAGFEDVSQKAGITIGRWAWGALFMELNNDGLPDLYVPNGFATNENPDDL